MNKIRNSLSYRSIPVICRSLLTDLITVILGVVFVPIMYTVIMISWLVMSCMFKVVCVSRIK